MPFLKVSYIYFAIPKPHEAKQFSKILSKSLDPTVQVHGVYQKCQKQNLCNNREK
jgi:hypothetical protein